MEMKHQFLDLTMLLKDQLFPLKRVLKTSRNFSRDVMRYNIISQQSGCSLLQLLHKKQQTESFKALILIKATSQSFLVH